MDESSSSSSSSSNDDGNYATCELRYCYAYGSSNGIYNTDSEGAQLGEKNNVSNMNRVAGLPRGPFRKVTHCIFDLDGLLLGEFKFSCVTGSKGLG